MGLKFYFAPYSTAAVTVAVLAELEHGRSEPIAERVEVSIRNGETRTEQYLTEVNPNGMVPALVHDGTPIWESAAITMYLGELYGVDAQLYPPSGIRRGEAMKWISWANVRLGSESRQLNVIIQGQRACVDKEADEKAAREQLIKTMGVLDGQLKGKDYILGSEYTLADTHLWAFVSYPADVMKLDLSSLPNLTAWRERIGSRAQLKGL